jgi:HAD superfamily hydrolase (TIGR01450 family)
MTRRKKKDGVPGGLFARTSALDPNRPIQGFMFDVDGTLVLGDRHGRTYDVLPGAAEVLDALNAHGVPFVLLTNGTHRTPHEAADKLRSVGLAVADDQMLTPSSVAADHLARKGVKRALVLGLDSVGMPLAAAGVEVIRPGDPLEEEVEAVYVGWHPDCDMNDIESAAKAVWAGAKLYVASDVPFFATREGRSIGYSRAIIAAIRSITDARATIMGKPSPAAFAYVARILDAPADQIAVVGDDPDLENLMARRAGAVSFGVSTGIAPREVWTALAQDRAPDVLLDVVGDLLDVIDGLNVD